MKKPRTKTKLPDWDSLRGTLKDIKMDSVELQHKAFLLKYETKKKKPKTN